jgi:thioredoxin 1
MGAEARSETASSGPVAPLWVVALCAQWCGTCREFERVFQALPAQVHLPEGVAARWAWLDVEDQADLLGETDIENFPTLLVVRHGQPCFFGPILPHAATAARLIESCGSGGAAVDLPSGLLEGVSRWMTRHEAPAG